MPEKCPKCGYEHLTAAFNEHTEYPVTKIQEGMVDIETDNGNTYDSELIHIECDNCNSYWYSISAFLKDVEKAKEPKKT